MDIIFFIALIALVLAALGHSHSRTAHLPRAPFGADAEVDRERDRDLDRILHDLHGGRPA